MISSTSLKYARALLEVASEKRSEDAVLAELQSFAALLAGSSELRAALENPVLAFEGKRGVVTALGKRIPLSGTVQNFILITISNARIRQFESLVEAFAQVLDEKRGIRRGTVYSAASLNESRRQEVSRGMEKLTGGLVRLGFEEDADLIGGIKIRLGSTIFDGSIRARLDELERRLAR